MEINREKQRIQKIGKDYFSYLAKNYPVSCLSDEFYFFPRAEAAIKYLDRLDSFDAQKIKEDLAYVRALLRKLEDKPGAGDADYVLLRQSMLTFLRELGQNKVQSTDPTLYLKIILLGTDHIFSRISLNVRDRKDLLVIRLSQVPRLLAEAGRNLKNISPACLETARKMAEAGMNYFSGQIAEFLAKEDHLIREVRQTLAGFGNMPENLWAGANREERTLLEAILRDSFSYERSTEEIYEIALQEYRQTLKELKNNSANWQKDLARYAVSVKNTKDLLMLYAKEISRLKRFFREKDIITIPQTREILVRETPAYLEPVRASASYSCPLSRSKKARAYFYVTASNSINNEYIFLTAHETYPGHHLLDALRLRQKNPIRRQIESALFYEGWSSYAEKLVAESGYVKNPAQKMVGLKRQAWRAVRAMLDVGVRTNKLSLADAGKLLKGLGYSPRIVKSMLTHYVLTPGYQLCYTIGKYEIERLREKYATRLGLKKFHDLLLAGGQLPFSLIEKRMAEVCEKNSQGSLYPFQ